MRNPNLVLQNQGGDTASPAASTERAASPYWHRSSHHLLTPHETDSLLSESIWGRRVRRVLADFRDNYSGDFRLFRIY